MVELVHSLSCPPLPAGSLEVHLSLQLGSAQETPRAVQVPCSRWLQKADTHGQQLGLARAWWFLHVPEIISSSRPRCAGCPGVRDPSRGGRGHQSRGEWALWLSSQLCSTPLSPPQEALFVKLGRLLRRRLLVFTRRILLYPGSGFGNLS